MPQIDPNDYDLSGLGIDPKILPPEYGRATLSNLDALLEHRERGQRDRIYDEQEERGLFKSGQTARREFEEVVLPGEENRRRSLLDLVGGALGQQREERMGAEGFERTRLLAGEEWQRRLEELELGFRNQKAMIQFQKELGLFDKPKKPGFFDTLGQSFASGFGGGLGSGAAARVI